MAKVMSRLKIPPIQVLTASSCKEALQFIHEKTPEIIISEYEFKDGTGIDLLPHHIQNNKNSLKRIFILTTRVNIPLVGCLAAENEVDAFVPKPFTAESMQNELMYLIEDKSKMNEYKKLVASARESIVLGDFETAHSLLDQSLDVTHEGLEAHYLKGVAYKKQGDPLSAEKSFKAALDFNHYHYRTMVALFDIYFENEKFNDCSELRKRMEKIYPLSPPRVKELSFLALRDKNYELLSHYFEFYEQWSGKTKDAGKALGNGLLEYGKLLMKQKKFREGVSKFRQAEVASEADPMIVTQILSTMVSYGLKDEVKGMSSRVSQSILESFEVKKSESIDFFIRGEYGHSLKLGLSLLKDGHKDPLLFQLVIMGSLSLNRRETVIEDLIEQATQAYPDLKKDFSSLIEMSAEGFIENVLKIKRQ
tara:strand:- start:2511 stop:3773 length:1263 start_codon:yes stop_codon:yes gene_type:complete